MNIKNNKKFSFIPLMILALVITNCNERKKDSVVNNDSSLAEARRAIDESNAIYFSSFANNDSTIFLNRYAEDACLMPANSPKLCGKDAIANFFREKYNKGYRGGEFVTKAVYGDGNKYVTEEAVGRIFDASGQLMSEGKILVLWKKTSEGWKMYRDSFSGDSDPCK